MRHVQWAITPGSVRLSAREKPVKLNQLAEIVARHRAAGGRP